MKILVLAGGYDQKAFIVELKRRGHEVVLADYFDNPPAKDFADKYLQISTLDEDLVLNAAKREKVEMVLTACTDQALLTAATVSEKLGLPFYLDAATAFNVTNKAYMKSCFAKNGIPTSGFRIFQRLEAVKEYAAYFSYPVIVKPCDCNSSKGVVKANCRKDLMIAAEKAFSLSRSQKIIIEDFVEGMEVSVDCWIHAGKVQILAISETRKTREDETRFTIYQSRYPANILLKARGIIEDTANQIARAFNLQKGPLLIQGLVHNETVNVIEFSARMGGGSKYKFVEYVSGVDIMKRYVDFVLGEELTPFPIPPSARFFEVDYVYAYNGIYGKHTGFDKLLQGGFIQELFEYKKPGSSINGHTVSGDRVLGFLIQGDSAEKLDWLREKIINETDILDISGKSILYRKPFIH